MENLPIENVEMGVLNQGVDFIKDHVKSGDDLNSNISKNITEIVNNYNNIENISEASKERVVKDGINAFVKIACDRNVCTVWSVVLSSLIFGGSLIAVGLLNKKNDS